MFQLLFCKMDIYVYQNITSNLKNINLGNYFVLLNSFQNSGDLKSIINQIFCIPGDIQNLALGKYSSWNLGSLFSKFCIFF